MALELLASGEWFRSKLSYGYDVKVEGRLISQLVLFLIRSVQDVKILRMELVYLHQAIALNKQ